MAPRKPRQSEEAIETDRIEGQPHPRETYALVGQDDALTRAAHAIRGGHIPQGWLLSGPPGVGKATLAYRIARYVLRYGATDAGPANLAVGENDPVAMQVAAGAHPGLLLLKRSINPKTGKLMTVLSVDEIRRLSGFFGMTSGAGGWRVAIIDTADDMNDQAANALLKALEEPPARAMLILLANAPGRLLPTIRSRCQRLNLSPLPAAVLDSELAQRLPELSDTDRAALARLAGGSLGLALQLAAGEGVAIASDAERLIDEAANPDFLALLSLAERIARLKDGLETLGEFLILTLGDRIRTRARRDAGDLRPWLEIWEKLNGLFARAHGLHLEPRQTILTAAHALEQTARRETL